MWSASLRTTTYFDQSRGVATQ
uniref:Uncharacterized protein n=1 Tax=Arundo donax TaxID=35708 RepID=A0A0A9EQZ1_ARUDO